MDVETIEKRVPSTASLLLAAFATTVSGLLLVSGCSSVPVTGRRQLLVMSQTEENKLGLTAYQQVLEEEPVTKQVKVSELVRRVGNRIAAVADRPDFDWDFNVIESPTQNAFCLPGGKVAVYTGILPVCRTEAGLAVVMSHEIGHAIARHGGERMSHQTVQNTVKKGVELLVKDTKSTTQNIVLTAYGAGAQYGAILPYSRKHELEADEIGVMLMAKAGYDPTEAPEFWERFSAAKEGSETPMEFLSTHPSDARRSAALREKLPEAMQAYQQAAVKYGQGIAVDTVMQPGI